jgi:quaternary ammonium compound-resistance protein SugE
MAWVILLVSGGLEVVWATAMKASDGFSKFTPTLIMFCTAALGFWLLGYAMRSLPLGTAYAVWVGIGAVGAFVIGVVWFEEELTLLRIGSVSLIVLGIIGLRLSEEA